MRRVTRDLDLEDLRLTSSGIPSCSARSLGLGLARARRSADLATKFPSTRRAARRPPKGSPVRPLPHRSHSDSERGQALVLIVVTLTVLLGAAALTIDVGYAYFAHRSLQADADAAALAGAGGLPNTTTATNLAKQYSGGTGGKNIKANVPDVDTTVAAMPWVGGLHDHERRSRHPARDREVVLRARDRREAFEVNAGRDACSPGLGSATLVDEGTSSCPLPPGPCVLGYPFNSSNPRTSVVFNESEVLRAFAPSLAVGRRGTNNGRSLVQRRARADARCPAGQ